MMRLIHKKEGFTLIELLIVILTGSIVTMAATTVLLLAFRINKKSMDTISRQSVTRIMLSVLENMSSDGEYELKNNYIQEDADTFTPVFDGTQQRTGWSINKKNEINPNQRTPLISYIPPSVTGTTGKIITGDGQGESAQTLVDDIGASMLYKTYSPFDYVKDLYTFSVEIEGKIYESSVYSRTQENDWRADDPLVNYEDGRNVLVAFASSQVGSTGRILDMSDRRLGNYYSQWYAIQRGQQFVEESTDPNIWSKNTPWCATFASWVLSQVPEEHLITVPKQANVNILWLQAFAQTDEAHIKVNDIENEIYNIPQPGDLIFFEYGNESEDVISEETGLPTQDLSDLIYLTNNIKADIALKLRYESENYMVNKLLHYAGQYNNDKYLFTYEEYLEYIEDYPLERLAYVPYQILIHGINIVGDGLDHVGIVTKVEGDYVYTIEGNVGVQENSTSGNDVTHRVIIRKHAINNPDIFGYATLKWAGNP